MIASPHASPAPLPQGEGTLLTNYRERKLGARELRRTETQAEQKLWSCLRDRKLGGLKFRRQFPLGRFFADFCCVEARLVIEADGGGHRKSLADDANRTLCMEEMGFHVLRFWNSEILSNTDVVCEKILTEIKKMSSDSKKPSPPGRGHRKAG